MCHRTIRLLSILLIAGSMRVFAQTAPATTSAPAITVVSTISAEPQKINLLQPLQQMLAKLKKLQSTGDPEFDFSFGIKIHTQGTRDLLKTILQANPDSALSQTVKTMLSTAEMDEIRITNMLRELKPYRPNAAFSKQQSRTIAAIGEKLKQSASTYKLTNDLEKNIVLLVSDQRQDAINLATTYLQFGKATELRNFAQQLIEKAKLDLDLLKTRAGTNK